MQLARDTSAGIPSNAESSPSVVPAIDTYVYWTLASPLAFLASSDRGSHREIIPFFRERVERIEVPVEHVKSATHASVWIDVASSARIPEIDGIIRTFVESLPAGYDSKEFGTADHLGKRLESVRPRAKFAHSHPPRPLSSVPLRSIHSSCARP